MPSGSPPGYLAYDRDTFLPYKTSPQKHEYDKCFLNYESNFDIKVTRMTNRDKGLQDSMLAYTARMRKIANARNNQDRSLESPDSIPLVVRAKHIPKFPVLKTNRRRPASLDELIGKSQAERNKHRKEKPKSASRLSLPSLPDKYAKGSHHVRISFVSASDLYDIVDFSIRNKSNKKETLRFLQMESEVRDKQPTLFYRPSAGGSNQRNILGDSDRLNNKVSSEDDMNHYDALPPIETRENDCENDTYDKESSSVSPDQSTGNRNKQSPQAFKRRPNRAKRMQINKPDLDAIPENDIPLHRKTDNNEKAPLSPTPKQSPRTSMQVQSHLTSIPENDINETSSDRKKHHTIKGHNYNHVNGMVRLEPLGQHDKKHNKDSNENVDPHLKVKLKAQKRFRKLIFLRDVPDRNNRI